MGRPSAPRWARVALALVAGVALYGAASTWLVWRSLPRSQAKPGPVGMIASSQSLPLSATKEQPLFLVDLNRALSGKSACSGDSVKTLESPSDVASRSCSFVTTAIIGHGAGENTITQLPVFSNDAARYFRCWAMREYLIGKRSQSMANTLMHACFRIKSVPLDGALLRGFSRWVKGPGLAWAQATSRAAELSGASEPLLLSDVLRWKNALPASAALAPPQAQWPVIATRYGMVLPSGKVVNIKSKEVYYPQRAPNAQVELFRFENGSANLVELEAFNRSINAGFNKVWFTCLSASGSMYHIGIWGHRPCARGSAFAVARLLVLSMAQINSLATFWLEALPRFGPMLDWLIRDETVTIHVACVDRPVMCNSVLTGLGIASSRIFSSHKNVFAYEVLIPPHSNDPLTMLWGLETLRQRLVPPEKRVCSSALVPRVMVLQREAPELHRYSSSWYVAIEEALRVDPNILALNFSISSPIEDSDLALMSDSRAHIRKLQNADVLIGVHGDGLALISLASACAQIVDVHSIEHSNLLTIQKLALGLGMGMFPVLFTGSFSALYRDVRLAVRDAVAAVYTRRAKRRLCVIGVAKSPEQGRLVQNAFETVLVDGDGKSGGEPVSCQEILAQTNAKQCSHVGFLNSHVSLVTPVLSRDWLDVLSRSDTVDFISPPNQVSLRVLRLVPLSRARENQCREPWGKQVRVFIGVAAGTPYENHPKDTSSRLHISLANAPDLQLASDVATLGEDLEPWKVPRFAAKLGLQGKSAVVPLKWFYMEEQGHRVSLPRHLFSREPVGEALEGGSVVRGLFLPLVLAR